METLRERENSYRWLLPAYWVMIFLATHWPRVDHFGPGFLWGIPHLDKVVHFTMYAGWMGICLWLVRTRGRRPKGRLLVGVALVGVAYAAFDEISQGWVGRDPELLDFAADVLGILVATAVHAWWRPRRR